MIAVIILTKSVTFLVRAVKSITRTHRSMEDIQIIVVDDGLSDKPRLCDSIHYVQGKKPFCFAANVNLGIAFADSRSDIFLMNDDCFFISADGLRLLETVAYSNERIGLLSPVFARKERTASQRLGHFDPDHGLWIEEGGYLTFAAVYLRRSVFDEIGNLDERYAGYGYEDNDYSLRMRLGGYQLGVLPSVVLAHGNEFGEASSTFRTETNLTALMLQNRELFIRKWGHEIVGVDELQLDNLVILMAMV